MPSVLQSWVEDIPMMQQSVLMAAVRGPDGLPKNHVAKAVQRWLRRSFLLSAFDGEALLDPLDQRGGSFTGPVPARFQPGEWEEAGEPTHAMVVDATLHAMEREWLASVDEMPYHYVMHVMHAAEVLGYQHPDIRVARWWRGFYQDIVNSLHLYPEPSQEFHNRLGDTEAGWQARTNDGLSCEWMEDGR